MNSHRVSLVVGVAAVAVLLPATTAFAQWPTRVDTDLLITDETIFASAPAIDDDGNGGVFAAWNDRRNNATTGEDLFAQYYDVEGVAQWPANGVPVATAPNRQDGAIVVSAGGGSVYIVWSDERGSANNERIFAQLLDENGDPQWVVNGIRVGPNEFDQDQLVAVSDGGGNLLVAWAEATNDFRTFVQKIDADGDLLWGANGFEFSSGVFGGAFELNVIPDGAGGAVLGWIQFGDNPRRVWTQRILADGTPAFAAVDFGDALGNFLPMAPDGTGGAFLGWQVDNGTNDNLQIQRVDGDGMLPWGTASTPLVDATNVQDNLHVVSDDAGGAWFTWDDPRTGVDDVYFQHVDADGDFSFAANGLPVATPAAQRFTSRLISDGARGIIVSFRFNQDGTFAQRIDTDGNLLWGDLGSQLTDNGTVNFPSLTPDGNGGAILGALAFADSQNRAALKRVLFSGLLGTPRLISLSTRALSLTGDSLLIPGFVISGTGTKRLLIRAVGPTLGGSPFNIGGVLPDPQLSLKRWNGTTFVDVEANDNWGDNANADEVESVAAQLFAFKLQSELEAALLVDLAAGQYTVNTSGVDNTTGIAIVELYDADEAPTSHVISLSNRGFVGVGNDVMIPGFAISHEGPQTVLIRVVGPTLGSKFGVGGTMDDPELTVFRRESDGSETAILANDNWGDGTDPDLTEMAAELVSAFSLSSGSADAALVATLDPGVYSVVGSAADGVSTGVVIVEVIVVPDIQVF